MLNVLLDKEITFDLPAGQYPAQLTSLKPFTKQTGKGRQDWIRLVWEVTVSGKEHLDCRAGRNFVLSFKPGSDLRNFLAPVLPPNFFKQNSAKNIDLEAVLVGRKSIITLSHYIGEGFDKPMVMVEELGREGKD